MKFYYQKSTKKKDPYDQRPEKKVTIQTCKDPVFGGEKKIPLIWRRVCPCKTWKYRCWGICICVNSSWTIVHQEEILFWLLIHQKDCYPSFQPKKEKMGKLSAQYSPKLYFSQGGAFPAKSNFFLYNWISRHTRSSENQKQAISKPGFLVYKNFIKATRNPVLKVCWGEH